MPMIWNDDYANEVRNMRLGTQGTTCFQRPITSQTEEEKGIEIMLYFTVILLNYTDLNMRVIS